MERRNRLCLVAVAVAFVVAASSVPLAQAAGKPNFIIEACLQDQGNFSQVLSHKLAAISEVMRLTKGQRTPTACAAACVSLGFNHAGVRNEWECWCGEKTRFTAEAKCTACQGDASLPCGGLGVMALYDLPSDWPRFKYNGCVRYTTPQDIAGLLPHTQWTTQQAAHWSHQLRQPAVCVKWCLEKGYRFSGWTHYYECHCGTFVPDVTEANCELCFADRRYLCGGNSQLAIYEVEQTPPRAKVCGGENHTAVAGYPMSLHCSATGDKPIVVAWHRVKGKNFKGSLGDASHILEVTGDLNIRTVEKADEGLYACEASNENMLSEMQRSNVKLARLTVQVPPSSHLEVDNNGKTLLYGETAVLRCVTEGDAPLIVQWYYRGRLLDPSASVKHVVRNQVGSAVVSLEIFNITVADMGRYECEVANPKIILPQARTRKSAIDLTASGNTMVIPRAVDEPAAADESQRAVHLQTGVGLSVGVIVIVTIQLFAVCVIIGIVVLYRHRRRADSKELYRAEIKANHIALDKDTIGAPIQQQQETVVSNNTNNQNQNHGNIAATPPPPLQLSAEPRRAVVYMDDVSDGCCSVPQSPQPRPPPPCTAPPSSNSHVLYPNAHHVDISANPNLHHSASMSRGGTLPRVSASRTNSRWSLNSWGNPINGPINPVNGHVNQQDYYSTPPDHRISRGNVSREAGV